MRKNYGLPYQGSKNQIVEDIIDFLPSGNRFVDLFGGGGSVSHCASLSGKYNSVLYNEINPLVVKAFKMAVNHEFDNENRWISREDFFKLRETDPYVALCFSFNNNMKQYSYADNIELYTKALHYKLVFNDNSLINNDINNKKDSIRLRHRETLNRIKSIGEDNLNNIIIRCGDYKDYDYEEGDVVYCDIPYENTDCRSYKGFNNKEFYDWAISRPYQLFFSSYRISDNRFIKVYEKEKLVACGATYLSHKNNKSCECIYSNLPYTRKNYKNFIFGV